MLHELVDYGMADEMGSRSERKKAKVALELHNKGLLVWSPKQSL